MTQPSKVLGAPAQEEVEDFLDAAAIPIQRVDRDGIIRYANRATAELLGYAVEDIVGHHVAEFHVDRGVLDAMLERLSRGEIVREYPARVRTKDGRIRFLEVAANAQLRDDAVVWSSWFTRDITPAQAARDEFLAILGHELRNPLAPILTAVQLMRLRGDDSTAREQSIIERQVNHLIHLVDDMLDISRITQGKIQLDKRPIKLAAAISKAIEIVTPACEERRHQLSVDTPGEDLWLEADETRLCQVITNLLINAIRYTDPGGRVELRVARDGDSAKISVNDNGSGIPPELLPHIFDLFVQGQRTAEGGRTGLGIGLALVRSLVAMHGGTVSASSAGAGRGSEFVVRLPLIDLRRSAPSEGDRNVRPGIAVTPRRVLLVDDNQDATELLAETLRGVGHEVLVAHDGGRALEHLKHFTPDIAILDIGLPDTDGYQLARSLRARLGTSVRIMAVTGYGQQRDVARARLAGFDYHFTKPVGLGKIIAAIEVDR